MIEAFILQYGYFLVYIGTVVEGEIVMVIAGYYAQQQILTLWGVILSGFLGIFTIDSIFYLLGYYKGEKFTQKISQQKKAKFFGIIHKRKILFLFLLRYIYGLRLVSLLCVGAAKVTPRIFFPVYAVSCIVWSTIFALGGYIYGKTFGEIAKKVEINLFLIITLFIVFAILKKKLTQYLNGKKL